ncbi:MAG: T9SS type A sorting domain-containing protein [Sphingobacteriales bacterium]|nr:T9SS type A sorting domain-containing protein [Sphingobacteriales bacterium]
MGAQGGVSISPNPASDEVHIEWQGKSGVGFKVIDIQGNITIQSTLQEGDNTLPINHLSKGIYIIKIDNIPEPAKLSIIR